jgi:1-acyl-sn-glycerol-3-phosphate acyltransferase
MIRIEPYTDKEVKSVLTDLLNDADFLNFVKTNLNQHTSKFLSVPGSSFLVMQLFKSKIRRINTIDSFQKQVKTVLKSIVKQTVDNFQTSGLELLDKEKPYLFISNHRDITLDSALCNIALDQMDMGTTYNAIGDNLVNINWMGNLLRLNKSFVISRSGETKKEVYTNLLKASQFIKDKLQSGNHVWIAQKQGRSKDGLDKTDPAVLKMLHIALRKECAFEDLSKLYNIIPCSVSYEIDPLAKEKSQQLKGESNKNMNEDISHIFKGVMEFKGNVSLRFADQIKGTYTPEELAQKLDDSILNSYELWQTNLYAYEYLRGNIEDDTYPVASKYFNELRASMTNEDLNYIMTQYANPVLACKENNNER